MSNSSTHRVVLVGHGSFGRLYGQALVETKSLCGVVVATETHAQSLEKQLGVPTSTSIESLITSVNATAVAVLSPTHLHAQHIRQGVKQRCHVLVIKPVCVFPATAQRIFAEVTKTDLVVMAGHEGVFAPQFRALENVVRSGELGELREVRWIKVGSDTLSGGRTRPDNDEAFRENSLGFVFATVMHELYVSNRLASRTSVTNPERVSVNHVLPSPTTPQLDCVVRYENGVNTSIKYDITPERPFRRGLQLLGSKGSAWWITEPGKSTLRTRIGNKERDLPYTGNRSSLPALSVVQAFLHAIEQPATLDETLLDGARAIESSWSVTQACAQHLGVTVNFAEIAGGSDE